MLASLRDYLYPKDPISSSLLCMTKKHYFSRLSVGIVPGEPGFEEGRWIRSEHANVEHLLDVFTTIDVDSINAWDTCSHFMRHLFQHKPRLVMLRPEIRGLPDSHRSKPRCLFELSQLLGLVDNDMQRKWLLIHAVKFWREWGNDSYVV